MNIIFLNKLFFELNFFFFKLLNKILILLFDIKKFLNLFLKKKKIVAFFFFPLNINLKMRLNVE
jgi:hypothetical protein